MRFRPQWLLAGVLTLLSSCGQKHLLTAPTEQSLEAVVVKEEAFGDKHRPCRGAASILGKTADGALFALYRPEKWNGDLLLYAHGYIEPQLPIALPTNDYTEAFRDALLEAGFAVAYSSFAENGLAIQDGMQHTRQVARLFASRLGQPRRTFLAGHSVGGLIALALAERQPNRYDGALVISGLVGGARTETDYVSHVRVLFDYFYPGVLPGDLLHLPAGTDLNDDIIKPIVAAIQAHPEGAFALTQIAQAPVPFASPEELVASIVQAIVLQVVELGDLLARTGGESFFDNSGTTYTGGLPDPLLADINARVARYSTSPQVDRFFERFYQPSGHLQIPLMTLYNSRDPVVPSFHERLYHDLVAAHGDLDLLVQRERTHYGHTDFSPAEMLAALQDLVALADKKCGDRKHLVAIGDD